MVLSAALQQKTCDFMFDKNSKKDFLCMCNYLNHTEEVELKTVFLNTRLFRGRGKVTRDCSGKVIFAQA